MTRRGCRVLISFVAVMSAGWALAASDAEQDKAGAERLGSFDLKAARERPGAVPAVGRSKVVPVGAERVGGLGDWLKKLPDLRPLFKTKCQLTYDGAFSPQTAIGDNCAEAKEKVINECKFWAGLAACRAGKMVCTHAATGAPLCLELNRSSGNATPKPDVKLASTQDAWLLPAAYNETYLGVRDNAAECFTTAMYAGCKSYRFQHPVCYGINCD